MSARVAGLVSGEYDIITNMPPDQATWIDVRRNVETRSVLLANVHLLTFDAKGPPTSDKRIRQALSLAINRQQLVEALWLGKAVIPDGHNYPDYGRMFLEGSAIADDPAKAKRLLQDALKDECPATILYRPLEIYGVKKSVSPPDAGGCQSWRQRCIVRRSDNASGCSSGEH